jgi:hypothetical protein
VKKISIAAALSIGALTIPVVAVAKKPENPGAKGKAKTQQQAHKNTEKKCKIKNVGYNASGTLTSYGLTQSQGTATPADTSDDRYSGTIGVDVTKANHKSTKGPQTFTVTDVKVNFHEGVTQPPAVGSWVGLHGKITKRNKKCTDQSGTGVVTLRKIDIKVAPTA